MRAILVRSLWLSFSLALVLGAAFRTSGFDDKDKDKDKDNPQSPIEVYEWSVWVGNPAQTTLNTTRVSTAGASAARHATIPDASGSITSLVRPPRCA